MKREDGDNVRGNRDGRGGANGGRRDRERPERRLLRALCPRENWKSFLLEDQVRSGITCTL